MYLKTQTFFVWVFFIILHFKKNKTMKNLSITLFLTLTSIFSFSQETIENTNSLEGQFDEVYKKSSNYKTYKVISKESFERLKLNVLDSLMSSKRIISEKDNLLTTYRNKIKETNLPVKIIMTVHDQIDTICEETYAEEWKEIMTELMEQAAKVIIPNGLLKADTNISKTWEK